MSENYTTKLYSLEKILSTEGMKYFEKLLVSGEVYIKDERMNETGSHKDRSFREWIKVLRLEGIKEAVMSSSGNAAISAAHYTKDAGIQLTIYVSPTMNETKKERLKKEVHKNVTVIESLTPKRDALRHSVSKRVYFMRSSVDDRALLGYADLAQEIDSELRGVDAIIVPTSSGATIAGLWKGFKSLKEKDEEKPHLFIVQTSEVHPIAEHFDNRIVMKERSLATAIVDRIALRKKEVISYLENSSGHAWIVTNRELDVLRSYVNNAGQMLGYESLMTLAVLKNEELRKAKKIVCLCTS